MKKIAQPNTVSGLHTKRYEVLAFLKRLDAERASVLRSLAHLDATLDLFVNSKPDLGRYAAPDSGSRTEFRGFVADLLRGRDKPISIIGTADLWVRHLGLEPNRLNRNRARSRVDAYFRKLVERGVMERVGNEGQSALWELVNQLSHD